MKFKMKKNEVLNEKNDVWNEKNEVWRNKKQKKRKINENKKMIEKQNEKKWSYKWKPKWKINEKNIFKHFQSVARSESYNPRGVVGIAALLSGWQTVGGGSIPHWSAGKGNGLGHKKNDFARCFELLDNILLPIFISFLQSSADTNDCLLKLHWPSFTLMTWQIWWTIFMSMDTHYLCLYKMHDCNLWHSNETVTRPLKWLCSALKTFFSAIEGRSG